jgi:hypothetical protein
MDPKVQSEITAAHKLKKVEVKEKSVLPTAA